MGTIAFGSCAFRIRRRACARAVGIKLDALRTIALALTSRRSKRVLKRSPAIFGGKKEMNMRLQVLVSEWKK